jgi:hypothetical protein
MLSDTKSVILWRELSNSRGMSIVKEGPRKQVVPCAFSNDASIPKIGYKLPFSSDLTRFSERLERQNDDIPRKAILCRICPQYGHALIFPRKCYYEAQCPLPLLFCADQHGEKAVKFGSRQMGDAFGRDPPSTPRSSLLGGSFLRRLSSTLSKKLAKNDPNKQLTNFGWMKKDEVPYNLRHKKGSQ